MSEVLNAVLETELENESEALEGVELSEKGQEAITGIARLLQGFKDELTEEAVQAVAKAAGFALAESKEATEEVVETEEVAELSDEAKEQVDIFKARAEASDKELEEVKKALAEVQDEKLTKEFVEKATTNYAHIPGESAELGAVLKDLHGASPELAEKVEGVLTAVEGLLATGSVIATQAEATNVVEAGDAEAQLEALKQENIAKGMKPAEAYNEALKANPELYKQL